jgi:hypothetical protein
VARYPDPMVVDESSAITLEINEIPEFAGPGVAMSASVNVVRMEPEMTANVVTAPEETLDLYPFMGAELDAPSLTPPQSAQLRAASSAVRDLSETRSAVWTWTIVALKPGRTTFTINVFGYPQGPGGAPVLVKSLVRQITVNDKPAPERLFEWLSENIEIVVGTSGPLALLLTWLALRNTQRRRPKSSGSAERKRRP